MLLKTYFVKTAYKEVFPELTEKFRCIRTIEKHHDERYHALITVNIL